MAALRLGFSFPADCRHSSRLRHAPHALSFYRHGIACRLDFWSAVPPTRGAIPSQATRCPPAMGRAECGKRRCADRARSHLGSSHDLRFGLDILPPCLPPCLNLSSRFSLLHTAPGARWLWIQNGIFVQLASPPSNLSNPRAARFALNRSTGWPASSNARTAGEPRFILSAPSLSSAAEASSAN